MKSLRKLTPLFRLIFASLILTIALVLLYKGASDPIKAQQSQPQERQIENTIPKHVPLDVKLTKEKEKNWKDLKNENWARDFQVEVTNTGDKPIYNFGLILYFDVPNDGQDRFRADIIYGRLGNGRIGSKPTADDIPLKQGESKTFTLQSLDVLMWEKGRREKGWRLPTKVRIKVGGLNFGDGTGFIGDQPFPRPSRSPETSKLDNFNSQSRRRKRANGNSRSVTNDGQVGGQKNHTSLPAVLPVSYFRGRSTLTGHDVAIAVDECPSGCFPLAGDYYVPCVGCPARINFWYSTSGVCGFIEFSSPWCMDTGDGQPQPCTVTDVGICMSEPAPTPIPTATPSPTPPPECFSCSSDAQCSCGHCDLNYGICYGNSNVGGCSEHFIDDCFYSMGYLPLDFNTHTLMCSCSHDYGGGGGGGGGGSSKGCQFNDCSCDPGGNGWECNSGLCFDIGFGGICAEGLLDPILINVGGGDFQLTNADNGVMFDFFGRGTALQMSWTDGQSNDAWLVLDWDKNGKIDNGKEMFSNVTPERLPTNSPIGFKALAMFDGREFGGNTDGVINQRDPIFRQLRLWQDANHNGISEPAELHTLPELGLESISLDYKESRRTDRWGNLFRYRVKVYGTNHRELGRWAYDVVLQSLKPSRPPQSIGGNRPDHSQSSNNVFISSQHRVGEIALVRGESSFLREISRASALSW